MKLQLAALTAALALTLTGCATSTPTGEATDADAAATSTPSAAAATSTPSAAAATSTPNAETTTSPAPSSTPEPAEAEDGLTPGTQQGPATFGRTFTYDDGLAVTVTAPKKFTPSQYSMGGEGRGTPLQFQVTIKNGSSKTFDPSMASATVQSGEAESEAIFDLEKNVGSAPQTVVLSGKTVKFDLGFQVLDPQDIVMELTPSWEHDAAIFTNNP